MDRIQWNQEKKKAPKKIEAFFIVIQSLNAESSVFGSPFGP
jgi:hypothetical protein